MGIECRRDDAAVLALLEPLDDPATHRAVQAERAALAELEGGCTLPMAAWARDVEDDETDQDGPALALDAAVFDPDGRDRVTVALRGPRDDPDSLGRRARRPCATRGPYRSWGGLGHPRIPRVDSTGSQSVMADAVVGSSMNIFVLAPVLCFR